MISRNKVAKIIILIRFLVLLVLQGSDHHRLEIVSLLVAIDKHKVKIIL